jgi:pimeloyl-ACP methyl ester carboxylesterase
MTPEPEGKFMPQIKAHGLSFEYDSFGRDTDPAVLLIMGFSAQMTMWPEKFCKGLAEKGFRVIRFDNRDAGKSTHLVDKGIPDVGALMARRMAGEAAGPIPYTLDDMAGDTVAILDGLGLKTAHIVGASMGGMIAQLVAARHRDRARSLVSIMSTTGNPALPQGKPEAMAVLTAPPASDSREDRIAQGKRIWRTIGSPGFPATDAELEEVVIREVDRVPFEPTGAVRQMAAILAADARNDILKNVRCPALVIHGADDPLLPVEGGRDTAASIPGAKLVIVPGMAHDFTNAIVPVYLEHVGGFITAVERKTA